MTSLNLLPWELNTSCQANGIDSECNTNCNSEALTTYYQLNINYNRGKETVQLQFLPQNQESSSITLTEENVVEVTVEKSIEAYNNNRFPPQDMVKTVTLVCDSTTNGFLTHKATDVPSFLIKNNAKEKKHTSKRDACISIEQHAIVNTDKVFKDTDSTNHKRLVSKERRSKSAKVKHHKRCRERSEETPKTIDVCSRDISEDQIKSSKDKITKVSNKELEENCLNTKEKSKSKRRNEKLPNSSSNIGNSIANQTSTTNQNAKIFFILSGPNNPLEYGIPPKIQEKDKRFAVKHKQSSVRYTNNRKRKGMHHTSLETKYEDRQNTTSSSSEKNASRESCESSKETLPVGNKKEGINFFFVKSRSERKSNNEEIIQKSKRGNTAVDKNSNQDRKHKRKTGRSSGSYKNLTEVDSSKKETDHNRSKTKKAVDSKNDEEEKIKLNVKNRSKSMDTKKIIRKHADRESVDTVHAAGDTISEVKKRSKKKYNFSLNRVKSKRNSRERSSTKLEVNHSKSKQENKKETLETVLPKPSKEAVNQTKRKHSKKRSDKEEQNINKKIIKTEHETEKNLKDEDNKIVPIPTTKKKHKSKHKDENALVETKSLHKIRSIESIENKENGRSGAERKTKHKKEREEHLNATNSAEKVHVKEKVNTKIVSREKTQGSLKKHNKNQNGAEGKHSKHKKIESNETIVELSEKQHKKYRTSRRDRHRTKTSAEIIVKSSENIQKEEATNLPVEPKRSSRRSKSRKEKIDRKSSNRKKSSENRSKSTIRTKHESRTRAQISSKCNNSVFLNDQTSEKNNLNIINSSILDKQDKQFSEIFKSSKLEDFPENIIRPTENTKHLEVSNEKSNLSTTSEGQKLIKITREQLKEILGKLNEKSSLKKSKTQCYKFPDNEEKVRNKNHIRKEVSFSQLNLQPVVAFYTTPSIPLPFCDKRTFENPTTLNTSKSFAAPILTPPKERKLTKPKKRTKIPEQQSVVSEAVTKTEKSQYVSGKRYLVNRTTRNFAYSENIIERSKKALRKNGSSTLEFTVEGVEPPKMIKPNTFSDYFLKKSASSFPKRLHVTVLSVVEIKPTLQNISKGETEGTDDSGKTTNQVEDGKTSIHNDETMFGDSVEIYTANLNPRLRRSSRRSSSSGSESKKLTAVTKLNQATTSNGKSIQPPLVLDSGSSPVIKLTNQLLDNLSTEKEKHENKYHRKSEPDAHTEEISTNTHSHENIRSFENNEPSKKDFLDKVVDVFKEYQPKSTKEKRLSDDLSSASTKNSSKKQADQGVRSRLRNYMQEIKQKRKNSRESSSSSKERSVERKNTLENKALVPFVNDGKKETSSVSRQSSREIITRAGTNSLERYANNLLSDTYSPTTEKSVREGRHRSKRERRGSQSSEFSSTSKDDDKHPSRLRTSSAEKFSLKTLDELKNSNTVKNSLISNDNLVYGKLSQCTTSIQNSATISSSESGESEAEVKTTRIETIDVQDPTSEEVMHLAKITEETSSQNSGENSDLSLYSKVVDGNKQKSKSTNFDAVSYAKRDEAVDASISRNTISQQTDKIAIRTPFIQQIDQEIDAHYEDVEIKNVKENETDEQVAEITKKMPEKLLGAISLNTDDNKFVSYNSDLEMKKKHLLTKEVSEKRMLRKHLLNIKSYYEREDLPSSEIENIFDNEERVMVINATGSPNNFKKTAKNLNETSRNLKKVQVKELNSVPESPRLTIECSSCSLKLVPQGSPESSGIESTAHDSLVSVDEAIIKEDRSKKTTSTNSRNVSKGSAVNADSKPRETRKAPAKPSNDSSEKSSVKSVISAESNFSEDFDNESRKSADRKMPGKSTNKRSEKKSTVSDVFDNKPRKTVNSKMSGKPTDKLSDKGSIGSDAKKSKRSNKDPSVSDGCVKPNENKSGRIFGKSNNTTTRKTVCVDQKSRSLSKDNAVNVNSKLNEDVGKETRKGTSSKISGKPNIKLSEKGSTGSVEKKLKNVSYVPRESDGFTFEPEEKKLQKSNKEYVNEKSQSSSKNSDFLDHDKWNEGFDSEPSRNVIIKDSEKPKDNLSKNSPARKKLISDCFSSKKPRPTKSRKQDTNAKDDSMSSDNKTQNREEYTKENLSLIQCKNNKCVNRRLHEDPRKKNKRDTNYQIKRKMMTNGETNTDNQSVTESEKENQPDSSKKLNNLDEEDIHRIASIVKTNVLKDLEEAKLLKSNKTVERANNLESQKEVQQLDEILERNIARALKQNVYYVMVSDEIRGAGLKMPDLYEITSKEILSDSSEYHDIKSCIHDDIFYQQQVHPEEPKQIEMSLKPFEQEHKIYNIKDAKEMEIKSLAECTNRNAAKVNNQIILKTDPHNCDCEINNCQFSCCVKYHQNNLDVQQRREQKKDAIMDKLATMLLNEPDFLFLESRLDKLIGIQQESPTSPQISNKVENKAVADVSYNNNEKSKIKKNQTFLNLQQPLKNPFNYQKTTQVAYTLATKRFRRSVKKDLSKLNLGYDPNTKKKKSENIANKIAKRKSNPGESTSHGKWEPINANAIKPLSSLIINNSKKETKTNNTSQSVSKIPVFRKSIKKTDRKLSAGNWSESSSDKPKPGNATVKSSRNNFKNITRKNVTAPSKTKSDEAKYFPHLTKICDIDLENSENQTNISSSKRLVPPKVKESSCFYTKNYRSERELSTYEKRKRYGDSLRRKQIHSESENSGVPNNETEKPINQNCMYCYDEEAQLISTKGRENKISPRVQSPRLSTLRNEPSTSKQSDVKVVSCSEIYADDPYVVHPDKITCFVCTKPDSYSTENKVQNASTTKVNSGDNSKPLHPLKMKKLSKYPTIQLPIIRSIRSNSDVKRNYQHKSAPDERAHKKKGEENIYQTYTVRADHPNVTDVFRNKFKNTESSISLFSRESIFSYDNFSTCVSPKSTASICSLNQGIYNTKSSTLLKSNCSDEVHQFIEETKRLMNNKRWLKGPRLRKRNAIGKPLGNLGSICSASKELFNTIEENATGKEVSKCNPLSITSSYEFCHSTPEYLYRTAENTDLLETAAPSHSLLRRIPRRKVSLLEACQQMKNNQFVEHTDEFTKTSRQQNGEDTKMTSEVLKNNKCYVKQKELTEDKQFQDKYKDVDRKTFFKDTKSLIYQNLEKSSKKLQSSSEHNATNATMVNNHRQLNYEQSSEDKINNAPNTTNFSQEVEEETADDISNTEKDKRRRKHEASQDPSDIPYNTRRNNTSYRNINFTSMVEPVLNTKKSTAYPKVIKPPASKSRCDEKHISSGSHYKRSKINTSSSTKLRENSYRTTRSCLGNKRNALSLSKEEDNSYTVFKFDEDFQIRKRNSKNLDKDDSDECFKIFTFHNVIELDMKYPPVYPIYSEDAEITNLEKSKLFSCQEDEKGILRNAYNDNLFSTPVTPASDITESGYGSYKSKKEESLKSFCPQEESVLDNFTFNFKFFDEQIYPGELATLNPLTTVNTFPVNTNISCPKDFTDPRRDSSATDFESHPTTSQLQDQRSTKNATPRSDCSDSSNEASVSNQSPFVEPLLVCCSRDHRPTFSWYNIYFNPHKHRTAKRGKADNCSKKHTDELNKKPWYRKCGNKVNLKKTKLEDERKGESKIPVKQRHRSKADRIAEEKTISESSCSRRSQSDLFQEDEDQHSIPLKQKLHRSKVNKTSKDKTLSENSSPQQSQSDLLQEDEDHNFPNKLPTSTPINQKFHRSKGDRISGGKAVLERSSPQRNPSDLRLDDEDQPSPSTDQNRTSTKQKFYRNKLDGIPKDKIDSESSSPQRNQSDLWLDDEDQPSASKDQSRTSIKQKRFRNKANRTLKNKIGFENSSPERNQSDIWKSDSKESVKRPQSKLRGLIRSLSRQFHTSKNLDTGLDVCDRSSSTTIYVKEVERKQTKPSWFKSRCRNVTTNSQSSLHKLKDIGVGVSKIRCDVDCLQKQCNEYGAKVCNASKFHKEDHNENFPGLKEIPLSLLLGRHTIKPKQTNLKRNNRFKRPEKEHKLKVLDDDLETTESGPIKILDEDIRNKDSNKCRFMRRFTRVSCDEERIKKKSSKEEVKISLNKLIKSKEKRSDLFLELSRKMFEGSGKGCTKEFCKNLKKIAQQSMEASKDTVTNERLEECSKNTLHESIISLQDLLDKSEKFSELLPTETSEQLIKKKLFDKLPEDSLKEPSEMSLAGCTTATCKYLNASLVLKELLDMVFQTLLLDVSEELSKSSVKAEPELSFQGGSSATSKDQKSISKEPMDKEPLQEFSKEPTRHFSMEISLKKSSQEVLGETSAQSIRECTPATCKYFKGLTRESLISLKQTLSKELENIILDTSKESLATSSKVVPTHEKKSSPKISLPQESNQEYFCTVSTCSKLKTFPDESAEQFKKANEKLMKNVSKESTQEVSAQIIPSPMEVKVSQSLDVPFKAISTQSDSNQKCFLDCTTNICKNLDKLSEKSRRELEMKFEELLKKVSEKSDAVSSKQVSTHVTTSLTQISLTEKAIQKSFTGSTEGSSENLKKLYKELEQLKNVSKESVGTTSDVSTHVVPLPTELPQPSELLCTNSTCQILKHLRKDIYASSSKEVSTQFFELPTQTSVNERVKESLLSCTINTCSNFKPKESYGTTSKEASTQFLESQTRPSLNEPIKESHLNCTNSTCPNLKPKEIYGITSKEVSTQFLELPTQQLLNGPVQETPLSCIRNTCPNLKPKETYDVTSKEASTQFLESPTQQLLNEPVKESHLKCTNSTCPNLKSKETSGVTSKEASTQFLELPNETSLQKLVKEECTNNTCENLKRLSKESMELLESTFQTFITTSKETLGISSKEVLKQLIKSSSKTTGNEPVPSSCTKTTCPNLNSSSLVVPSQGVTTQIVKAPSEAEIKEITKSNSSLKLKHLSQESRELLAITLQHLAKTSAEQDPEESNQAPFTCTKTTCHNLISLPEDPKKLLEMSFKSLLNTSTLSRSDLSLKEPPKELPKDSNLSKKSSAIDNRYSIMSDDLFNKICSMSFKTMMELHDKVSDSNKSKVSFKTMIGELCKCKLRKEDQLLVLPVLQHAESKRSKETDKSWPKHTDSQPHKCDCNIIGDEEKRKLLLQAKERELLRNKEEEKVKPTKPKQNKEESDIASGVIHEKDKTSPSESPDKRNALHKLRESLTDKELFEKLLDSYEKEEKIVDKLSSDEEFFKTQLESVISKESIESLFGGENEKNISQEAEEKELSTTNPISLQSKKRSSVDGSRKTGFEKPIESSFKEKDQMDISQKAEEEEEIFSEDLTSSSNSSQSKQSSLSEESRKTSTAILTKKPSKSKLSGIKEKVSRMFKSDAVKEIVAPRSYESGRNSYAVSLDIEEEEAVAVHKDVSIEENQKVKFSGGRQRFEEEKKILDKKKSEPSAVKQKPLETADSDVVQPDELGKCFLRGFRPDFVSLNGDTCLYISKQEKESRMNEKLLKQSYIDFSERDTPLEFLLALGFSVDEASNAIKDEDVKSRLFAAITEARIWINQISTVQGTLLYLIAYKAKPRTMRYYLQLVEAIINKRINNAVKLDAFLRILEKVEDGDLTMINILGSDKFDVEENDEKIVKKQLRQLFIDVYKIAEEEANLKGISLSKDSIILLRILAAKYRAGLHPHLQVIARYIGQGLLCTEVRLEAAMIYLSRLDTADVNLNEFEQYCAIKRKPEKTSVGRKGKEKKSTNLTEDEIALKYLT